MNDMAYFSNGTSILASVYRSICRQSACPTSSKILIACTPTYDTKRKLSPTLFILVAVNDVLSKALIRFHCVPVMEDIMLVIKQVSLRLAVVSHSNLADA